MYRDREYIRGGRSGRVVRAPREQDGASDVLLRDGVDVVVEESGRVSELDSAGQVRGDGEGLGCGQDQLQVVE